MVYETESLRVCHELSRQGEEAYHAFLERRADEILFRAQHPLKWAVSRIREAVSSVFRDE